MHAKLLIHLEWSMIFANDEFYVVFVPASKQYNILALVLYYDFIFIKTQENVSGVLVACLIFIYIIMFL